MVLRTSLSCRTNYNQSRLASLVARFITALQSPSSAARPRGGGGQVSRYSEQLYGDDRRVDRAPARRVGSRRSRFRALSM
jgi:hypothetical protein